MLYLDVMVFPVLQPEENLRNFFVTNLQQIREDLEGFPLVEATKIDPADDKYLYAFDKI